MYLLEEVDQIFNGLKVFGSGDQISIAQQSVAYQKIFSACTGRKQSEDVVYEYAKDLIPEVLGAHLGGGDSKTLVRVAKFLKLTLCYVDKYYTPKKRFVAVKDPISIHSLPLPEQEEALRIHQAKCSERRIL